MTESSYLPPKKNDDSFDAGEYCIHYLQKIQKQKAEFILIFNCTFKNISMVDK